MNKEGAIIIVEDDQDDQDLLTLIFSQLGIKNEIVMFSKGLDAHTYFKQNKVEPFLIISDINMPKMNGIELKERIKEEKELNLLTVPFIFMSTGKLNDDIKTTKLVQGYLKKPPNLTDYTKAIKELIEFWSHAMDPYF